MNVRSLATYVSAVLSCALTQANADVVSSFDTSLNGWTGGDITHASSGGNPDGYARFTDPDSNNSSIFAPAKFLGDWTSFKTLSFDHKIFTATNVNGFADYEIEITGGANSATWNSGSPPSSQTDWVSHSILLQEANWSVSGDWSGLLSNVDELRLRIELVIDSGTDVEGVDNVRLAVPEPSTLFVIPLLAFTAFVRRKRRKEEASMDEFDLSNSYTGRSQIIAPRIGRS